MYKLFILDDEAAVVKNLCGIIDWEAYNVEIAGTATDSVEALVTLSHGDIDILITDVCMPGYDGLTLMRMAMEKSPKLRVIVISAHDSFRYVKASLQNGAENYLLKPVDPAELTETLRRTLANLDSERHADIGITVFKGNILDRWLHNGIHETELMDRAELLGLDMHAESYTAFSLHHPDWTLADALHALAALEARHPGASGLHAYAGDALCVTGVLIGPPQDAEPFRQALSRLRAAVPGALLTVGIPVQAPGDLWRSLKTVERYRIVQDRATPLLLCSGYEACGAENATVRELEERLGTCLADGRREECLALLDALRTAMQPQTDAQRRCCAQSIAACLCGVEMRSRPGMPASEAYRERIEQFRDIPTPKLGDWLNELCMLTHSQLQRSRSLLHPYVQKALQCIQEEYAGEISLKTIAGRFGVSPAYLGHLFHEQTGAYFNDHLTSIRLDAARRLIVETALKVNEIAERTGFGTQTYFNRIFRREHGVSPGEYRQQARLGQP